MKVTRNTPDQLIIENNPWLFGILLALIAFVFTCMGLLILASGAIFPGIAFLVVGLLITSVGTFVFIRRVQVIFDRPNNLLEIRRKSVSGMDVVKHELSDFSHAVVQRNRMRSANGQPRQPAYRAVLVLDKGMSAGDHPVTQMYHTGSGADRMAEAINTWHGVDPTRIS
jgi:hypothetical protein